MEGYIAGVFVLTIFATVIVIGIRVYEHRKASRNSPNQQTDLFN